MNVWIVHEGVYYTDSKYVESVHTTKAGAVKHCRKAGFKFSKEQNGLFCNDRQQLYRRLQCRPLTGKVVKACRKPSKLDQRTLLKAAVACCAW